MIEIRELHIDEKRYIPSIAMLHRKAFPSFFLTQLGFHFLCTLYKCYLSDSNSGIIIAEENGDLRGFIAYSNEYSLFYRRLLRKHLMKFALCSLGAALRHPSFVMRLLGAFSKSRNVAKKEKYVELASICTAPGYEEKGIGTSLVNYLKAMVDFDEYAYINLETDAVSNEKANEFYRNNGFSLSSSYTTREGRRMNEYRYHPSSVREERRMKTLFVNAFIYLPGEKAVKRTFFLFDMMKSQGYDVHFLTSDFNHYEKKVRDTEAFYRDYQEYRDSIHFVRMRPYSKNISLSRYLNNYICERRMLEWIKKNGKDFDIIYITLPALYLASHVRKFCDRYGIRIVIDVNDLWPESLKTVFRNDIVYNIVSLPFIRNRNNSYASADAIVAVSKEYLDTAKAHNTRAREEKVVYIGAMLSSFDKGVCEHSSEIIKRDDEIWITYIGTLGQSYDLDTLIDAVSMLGDKHIVLKILGRGPEEERLKKLSEKSAINVDFVGFVEYPVMAAYLAKTDICANCLRKRASQSIINKIGDYLASGKSIINCGPSREMAELIEHYECGVNYEAENPQSCMEAITFILDNPEKARLFGLNARRLAEEKFDRGRTHREIIDMLVNICRAGE